MCEYCEKGKLYKSCNFCGSAKMKISCSKEFNLLEVQGDKERFSLFKRQYCPRFDINFCPICGRDLKNDKDVKSADNYLPNKLEEENELRKKHLAGEVHELLTRMLICEEDIRYSRELSEELERQKMLNLFKKENK